MDLPITNGIASSKVDDKQDDFNFEIDNGFLYGDFLRSPSHGVYISLLIRFARVCSNVRQANNINQFIFLSFGILGFIVDEA